MSALSGTTRIQPRQMALPRIDAGALQLGTVAISTTIMFESMRVLVSYLVVVVGQANRTALIRDTLLIFLAMAAAPILIRLAGSRRTLALTATAIASVRVTLQFWTDADARLLLAAAIVILWGWFTITMVQRERTAVAFGLLLGMTLDVAIRVAFMTMDLPWSSGFWSGAVSVTLAGVLIAGASLGVSASEHLTDSAGPQLALLSVGPGLAMYHLVGGNLGLAQTKTGLGFAAAAALIGLGLALGTIGSMLENRHRDNRSLVVSLSVRLLTIVMGAASLWIFWTRDSAAPYALPLVVSANMMLVSAAVFAGTKRSSRSRFVVPTAWFTLGMLVQVGILFLYYDASGRSVYIVIAAVALALGALSSSFHVNQEPNPLRFSCEALAVIVTSIALLAVICAWQLFSISTPASDTTFPTTFSVMTYNLQDGFAADNSFDLAAQAAVIESAHPDVVVLQEVSRGWLVTSGADEALWLSHRLNMPIYFGGNSDDGLWGNAILTRAPVSEVRQLYYTVTKNLQRGTIEVSVQTRAGTVWFVGTHLDNPKAADNIRLEQAQQLIASLNGRYPAVVMGDFNADPRTDVLNTFSAAGLTDPGLIFTPDVTTTTDARRLDYVLVSRGIQVESQQVVESPASDHRPVVARLTLSNP